MSDQSPDTEPQANDIRDLTKTIREIDINDPERKKNEKGMKAINGKSYKFTE
ncbi:MAG TPA: hypothetical protein VHA78_05010 [Candidatus Peribacteraceae bacterium]|nr:hypothetical protein [Candidatus Peribacteraceae bacterium]